MAVAGPTWARTWSEFAQRAPRSTLSAVSAAAAAAKFVTQSWQHLALAHPRTNKAVRTRVPDILHWRTDTIAYFSEQYFHLELQTQHLARLLVLLAMDDKLRTDIDLIIDSAQKDHTGVSSRTESLGSYLEKLSQKRSLHFPRAVDAHRRFVNSIGQGLPPGLPGLLKLLKACILLLPLLYQTLLLFSYDRRMQWAAQARTRIQSQCLLRLELGLERLRTMVVKRDIVRERILSECLMVVILSRGP